MEKRNQYRNAIKKVILEHQDYRENHWEEFDIQVVFDEQRGHFFLMNVGWKGMSRLHSCLMHIDLKPDGKIWIQKDFTEDGIAARLMELGIPKQQIVLGFHAPFKRPFTEFAPT